MSNPRSNATSSVREQKLARVIDREVAPIWHDRFARMLLRELPTDPELFALDIHSGPGHTTAELLQRLDESARIVALGRDPWLMQVAKTRVRPEWKRRVYFKAGDIDDVTGMNDATYDLTLANLVLGEQVVEWQPALAELQRVTKPGGQVLVTLPLYGTWQEVEDLFEELLRDEGMRKEVATLQKLRRRRPKPSQLVAGIHELGLRDSDFYVEHERFDLLFRSGREFLFAPVIEHGPLRLWKAILGRAEKPQALFWRFKETIDTYYAGRVLAVTVIAGLVRLRVPGGPQADDFAASHWGRYPDLARLWGLMPGGGVDTSDDEFDLDLDIDLDEAIDALAPNEDAADTQTEAAPETEGSLEFEIEAGFGRGFDDVEVSGANELPAIDDAVLDDERDPFSSLLEELDAEAAARAAVEAEDAEAEAAAVPRTRAPSGRLVATLGNLDSDAPEPTTTVAAPGESGSGTRPKASDSMIALKARLAARKASESGTAPKLPITSGDSSVSPMPKPAKTESVVGPPPRIESVSTPRPVAPPPKTESVVAPPPPRIESVIAPPPVAPPRTESVIAPPPVAPPRARTESVSAPPPKREASSTTPIPKPSPGGSLASKLPKPPGGSLASKLPPRTGSGGSLASKLPPRSPGDGGTGSLLSRLPKRTPTPSKGTGPMPTVTKPGEDDPFAEMLAEAEELEEIDDIEELPGDSLMHGELDDEDDLADSFGAVEPDPSAGRSGTRAIPPLPGKKK